MIAILQTACGCEKAINVDYHFPRVLRVPLYKPVLFMQGMEDSPNESVTVQVRSFEFYRRRDDGILEYRERIETVKPDTSAEEIIRLRAEITHLQNQATNDSIKHMSLQERLNHGL